MQRLALFLAALRLAPVGLGLAFFSACSDDAPPSVVHSGTSDVLAREVAAAHFAEGQLEQARNVLAPLVGRATPAPEDLLRAAIVELGLHASDRARELLERAAPALQNSPALHYNLGQSTYFDGDLALAAQHFARAKALAPDDFPTRLMLAKCLVDTDEAEAEKELRALVAIGPQKSGSFHLTALYVLGRLLLIHGGDDEQARTQRDAESHAFLEDWSRLKAQGLTDPGPADVERGNFGRLDFPAREKRPGARTPSAPAFTAPASVVPELANARGLAALTRSEDWTVADKDGKVVGSDVGVPGVIAWGADGLFAVERGQDGKFAARKLSDGAVEKLRAFDLERDGDLDYWIVAGGKVELRIADGDGLTAAASALPELPTGIEDLEPVDFDHDGDLDLLLVGQFGVRLWRDDGAAVNGAFHDATAESGLDAKAATTWCAIEDFDTDQDVDLLIGGPERTVLYDNLRSGHFAAKEGVLPPGLRLSHRPLLGDFDGDGRPDLAISEGGRMLLCAAPGGVLKPVALKSAAEQWPKSVIPACVDVDLDGRLDVAWTTTDATLRGLAAACTSDETPFTIAGAGQAGLPLALADINGDGAVDLLRVTDKGLEIFRGEKSTWRGIHVALRGTKDNRRGVGAIVETRAGDDYQRTFWTGEPLLVGLGTEKSAAWIRVTWPNGVIQHELGIAAGSDRLIEQREGLMGSCPFLYTWNGTRYEFVTDVLGITPLGLPMAPGLFVPPDHDEYVLIRGSQLAPRDGIYAMQLTEELREVTYLDRVRLDVVDHPQAVEIYPDERFTFPPFPTPHTHTVLAPVAPKLVRGSDGVDWTSELAAIDGRFAAPFRPYRGSDPLGPSWGGQFLGLAPEHALELTFEGPSIASAKKLRLVMTGWFYWTDASVNMASSRTPSIHFVPPILAVPDGNGGWKDTGPPIGFPAGKLKSMVLDVTELLVRDDPRIRLTSTLRLYWDSIRLATDDDDAPLTVTSLEPASTKLWERGFSEPRPLFGEHALDWFEWEHLAPFARWNQTPGLYTRLGDVLPLIGDIDDRFVVMGAGDALEITFDARTLPPLAPGYARDYLLFLDGWGKDRDPNTQCGQSVEPLPFHGMTAYPPPAGESFPTSEAHRAWRRDWQSRPSKTWIETGPTRAQ